MVRDFSIEPSPEEGIAEDAYADAFPEPYDPQPEAALGDLAAAVRATSDNEYVRQPAGFAARLGAAAADLVIQIFVFLIAIGASLLLHMILPGALAGLASVLAGIGVPVLYSLAELFGSATPGKSIAGLRIARRDGYRPSLGQRAGRWAFKHSPLLAWVALVPLALRDAMAGGGTALGFIADAVPGGLALAVVAGCLMALLPARLALHDIVSGTAVFREEDLAKKPRYTGHGFRPVMQAEQPGDVHADES